MQLLMNISTKSVTFKTKLACKSLQDIYPLFVFFLLLLFLEVASADLAKRLLNTSKIPRKILWKRIILSDVPTNLLKCIFRTESFKLHYHCCGFSAFRNTRQSDPCQNRLIFVMLKIFLKRHGMP